MDVKKEIWMSLRMGPVLSYAPEIRDNLRARGFEIRFIEDMRLMEEETEQETENPEPEAKPKRKGRRKSLLEILKMKGKTEERKSGRRYTDRSGRFEEEKESGKGLTRDGTVGEKGSYFENLERRESEEDRIGKDITVYNVSKEVHKGFVKTVTLAREGETLESGDCKPGILSYLYMACFGFDCYLELLFGQSRIYISKTVIFVYTLN